MADAKEFRHLPLPHKIDGNAFFRKLNIPPQTQTEQNRQNRQAHGNNLKKRASDLSKFWNKRREDRVQKKLPSIKCGVPFLLQIDPSTDDNFLHTLGFEVVCDLDDGFIIVSSEDIDLKKFQEKVNNFICNKDNSGSPAKIYGLNNDDDRLSRILSRSLYEKWSLLDKTSILTVDISVECCGLNNSPNLPSKKENESENDYLIRCNEEAIKYCQYIDEIAQERQEQLMNIANFYNAELGPFIDCSDSFSVRVTIIVDGLRDIVENYSYVFEVKEVANVIMESSSAEAPQDNEILTINGPDEDSPIICVIDSGIQENHKYLQPAILSQDSQCFIPNETSTNDEYGLNGKTGGHGTRVAGAILYYNDIPNTGTVNLPFFIRNARVLNDRNELPRSNNICQELAQIVKSFYNDADKKTKIFNHSIGECVPFDDDQFKHMSHWAAMIDSLSYDNDILFIQAAGNVSEYIIKGLIVALNKPYPQYFSEKPTRLSNPAQSLQAITVGSISHTNFEDSDYCAIGKKDEISSFSRIGPGVWDSIKPDVVEYGGTHIINKNDNSLTTNKESCTDLIRTSPQGPAHDRDGIGTSFSTPKVAHIAGAIQKVLPNAPALLYRALIVQSARLPEQNKPMTHEQRQMLMRQMGYGIPNLERATENNEYRVTMITTDPIEISAGEAHIYRIIIPEELRAVGDDYNILVEITLSYAAKPRRTRRGIKGYMSTWLDWICSRIGEKEESFRKRVFETDKSVQDEGSFKWAIREQNNWGDFKGFNRKGQTLQKDWCVIKSNQLTDAFCVAVRGHKGWGSLFKAKYALTISFEAINQDIEIYEPIRLANIETEIYSGEFNTDEVRVEIDNVTGKK